MPLKLKAPKPKKRRRGNRLVVTAGEKREVYVADGQGKMRLVETTAPDKTTRVLKRSASGRLVMVRVAERGEPDLEVVHVCDQAEAVAQRFADDDCPWFFRRDGCLYLSASETGMLNKALVLSIAVKGNENIQLPQELADFVGVHPLLCDLDEVLSVQDNPRFARLRNFDFQIEDLPADIGNGRRAKNKARHEFTNWDQMLQAAGGLLHADVYENVRRGVDLMIEGVMQKQKGTVA